MPWKTVRDTGEDRFFILKALHVLQPGQTRECYLDLTMPERIRDYVYLKSDRGIVRRYPEKVEGDVVPAVAIETCGNYELFYSRRDPDVGLTVLRNGLQVGEDRRPIAAELGYILRDEGRMEEATTMFALAADLGGVSLQYYLPESEP